jgi:hypothetical protein
MARRRQKLFFFSSEAEWFSGLITLILLGDYRTPTIPIPKPPPFGLTELEIETLEKI